MNFQRWLIATLLVVMSGSICAQSDQRLPIIDMHLHASAPDGQGPPPLGMCSPLPMMPPWGPGQGPSAEVFVRMFKQPACKDPIWSPTSDDEMRQRTLAQLEKYNVIGVLAPEKNDYLPVWRKAARNRIIPAGTPFDLLKIDQMTIDKVTALKAVGDLVVIGEVVTQYQGISPDETRMEPFWKIAEDLDLPVGIHVSTGPPGTPYLFDGLKDYRARLHSPLKIEEVVVKHPKLRVYLMHAGYPMLDDLLAVLYTHPQVYVDVGVIVYTQPRAAFYRYLQAIMDAGFGNRVMFGSDNMIWPESIERSIQTIEQAPFLSEAQKRDIFYNNAARFLRLTKEEQARHQAM